jgi:dTDP-4-amino-4,6-dideoxygalactose transaminase
MRKLAVPFVDLGRIHSSLTSEFCNSLVSHIESSDFVLGNSVDAFEKEFGILSGLGKVVATNSGTSALHIALLALGIGPGDEVIVPSMTFIATAAAVAYVGATPVFVDIDEATWNINPDAVADAIGPRTRAVIVVHLHGLMAQVERILEVARRRSIFVIEDAAQAHLAKANSVPVGSLGDISCFSFYPGKNLGALGEGGAVFTSNPILEEKLRLLRNWYSKEKYIHLGIGFNYRMEAIQAAFLRVKLPFLENWTRQRERIAEFYDKEFESRFDVCRTPQGYRHVRHIYAIRTSRREDLKRHLDSHSIGWGLHYPLPLHLQPAFRDAKYSIEPLPTSERLASETISLPIFPGMLDSEIERVVECVNAFADGTNLS